MNVVSKQHIKQSETPEEKQFVNHYTAIPSYELSLDEFEVYALKRVKVLRKIEQMKTSQLRAEEIKKRIENVIKAEGLSDPTVDEASHFILRLSYCREEELRRWFLQFESALFQHRLRALSPEQLEQSVRQYAQLSPISPGEKRSMREPLSKLMIPNGEFESTQFYSVPFTQALTLVANRQCYLQAGYAYVPHTRVISILTAKFRSELARTLTLMANATSAFWANGPESVRLGPLLKNMHRSIVMERPKTSTFSRILTADTIQDSIDNMPLCMRQIQVGLKQDRTLKHQARLQFGFFLRTAEMPEEELVLFFQRHFTRVTTEQFKKQYEPSFKHMYKGKQGGGYTGYSCFKIVNFHAPSNLGEHHGCPYKHYDDAHLEALLEQLKIGTKDDRKAILELKQRNDYGLACLKHFQVMHPEVDQTDTPMDNVGNHPNAWFTASVLYHESKAKNPSPSSILDIKN